MWKLIKICIKIVYSQVKKKSNKLDKLTLWNAGSMLSKRSTTTGDSLPVTHIRNFHRIIQMKQSYLKSKPKCILSNLIKIKYI